MHLKRIALMVRTEGRYGRGILIGASAYARADRSWICQFQRPSRQSFERLAEWQPSGVIAEASGSEFVRRLKNLGCPVVNLGRVTETNLPTVAVDDRAVGRAAADYFLERGFRSFGFIGFANAAYAVEREAGYRERLESDCYTCSTLLVTSGRSWRSSEKRVRQWLTSLPRPAAVLASNDGRGIDLLETARIAGVSVPDDVSVLGVDDDDLLCELAFPPLSSVAQPVERIGHEAARLLDYLMHGGSPPPKPILLPPGNIVTRQSSDVLAIHDTDVAAAVRYIRQHAHEPIFVKDVLEEIAIGRRSLERRFLAQLGRTMLDEIHRAHFDVAKELLAKTELAMPAVAEKSGFTSTRHMSGVFQKLFGSTPFRYRRQHRLRT